MRNKESNRKVNRLPWILAAGLLMSSGLLDAATEVWSYSTPSPASVTVADGEFATVHYTVTNQSYRSKNLQLKAEEKSKGINASSCYLATKGSTCSLTLTINGSLVPPLGITEGPILCEEGNPAQCYQPSTKNVLKIYRADSITYQITPSAGTHINSIVPSGVQTVNAGAVQHFTVNADSGYVVEGAVGGTCPLGQWAGTTYTTGAITANCTVIFNALQQQTTISSAPMNITLTTEVGHSVPVTVTNTGSTDAYNVTAVLDSANHGVTVGGSTCGSVLSHVSPNNTCVITFAMGAGGSVGTTSALMQGQNTNRQSVAINIISPIAPVLTITSPIQANRVIPVSNGSLDIVVASSNLAATFNTDITAELPLAWGSAVTASYNNCTAVAPGDSCTIHLETTAPFVADQILINGTHNTLPIVTYVAFRYQGGLVFSVNGGLTKVVTENNISAPTIMWGVNYAVGGIGNNATAGPDSCNGTDGACTTQRIVKCLSDEGSGVGSCTGTPPGYPISLNTYAAGLCTQYNDGTYSDWYLPARCELMAFCPIQNVFANLYLLGFGNIANGSYWSSNEFTTTPAGFALSAIFDSANPVPTGGTSAKASLNNVRCARAIS